MSFGNLFAYGVALFLVIRVEQFIWNLTHKEETPVVKPEPECPIMLVEHDDNGEIQVSEVTSVEHREGYTWAKTPAIGDELQAHLAYMPTADLKLLQKRPQS